MDTNEEESDSKRSIIKMDSDTWCNVGKGDHDTSCGHMPVGSGGVFSVALEDIISKTKRMSLDTCPNKRENFDGLQKSKLRRNQYFGLDLMGQPKQQVKNWDKSDSTVDWEGPGEF